MPGAPSMGGGGASIRMAGGLGSFPARTPERNYTISGRTQDASGLPLGFCTVKLFNAATDVLVAQTTSDITGLYSFVVDKTQRYYEVVYKAGAQDVYGTSLNTLQGV